MHQDASPAGGQCPAPGQLKSDLHFEAILALAQLTRMAAFGANMREWRGESVRLTGCPNPPKARPFPEIAGNRANVG